MNSLYVPRRLLLGIALSLSFFLCNLQRACVSMSILLFSEPNSWTDSDKGLVLSAFGWGYVLSQVGGVSVARQFGARSSVALAVVLSGLVVTAFPYTVSRPLFSSLCYFLIGILQGPLWPGYWELINQWFPKQEKGAIVAFINLGALAGICVSFGLSSYIFEYLNWESSFYIFGGLSFAWLPFWIAVAESNPFANHTRLFPLFRMNKAEQEYLRLHLPKEIEAKRDRSRDEVSELNIQSESESTSASSSTSSLVTTNQAIVANPTPWYRICAHRVVFWLIVAQFCHNWTFYITVAWMPSYFKTHLAYDLKRAGMMAVLPFLLLAFTSQSAGFLSDALISRATLTKPVVRKLFQSISFVALITMFSFISRVEMTPGSIVAMFTVGLATMGMSAGGINACYPDLSVEHSGAIHALSNTFASLPAAMGIFLIGYILEKSGGDWSSIWGLSAFLCVVGFLAFNLGVNFEPIHFK